MNTKLNPTELTLTLSLKEEDEQRMQLVYASQLYQTFFAIFAVFDIDRTDPNSLKLKGVYLELINYKGIIDIGIVGVQEPKINDNSIEIKFKVKALHESAVLKYYKFNSVKTVKNNIDSQINFSRVLEPMNSDYETGINAHNVFDVEFYERDGLFTRKRTLRLDEEDERDFKVSHHNGLRRRYRNPQTITAPNRFHSKANYIEGVAVQLDTNSKTKAPGGRCPKSINIVRY